ncbi:HNH endonuclease signature motif containing protein [Rodentibacter caecimuris]|uniref:HNH endonuclease signature motif containing protein n=1 Tax=Rodentibacter caecimuris TaxID=1796644 RepID=UPI00258C9566|nr:HNH endonuclease signature motif containing protein [Rodentibacter heylii]
MTLRIGHTHFTQEQLDFIYARKELPRDKLAKLFNEAFERQVTRRSLVMLCCKKGWHLGKTVNQYGVAEEGDIRRARDGNFIRLNGKCISHARYVYEQHHGKLPDGVYVIHRNGDKYDDKLENLVPVSSAEIGILKGFNYRDCPGELKVSCELAAKLIHLTRTRKKHGDNRG